MKRMIFSAARAVFAKAQYRLRLRKAEQGDAEAQYELGVCYFKGEGVEKDEKEAVRWYRKAA
ncbi:MAG: SEL1-like repeat protein, partial [Akkermansiaceae bacterium]|nr:SEL1-like repeat protein [Akkermansiaceae bacterium]